MQEGIATRRTALLVNRFTVSGHLQPRSGTIRSEPALLPSVGPPTRSDDSELHAVANALLELDPDGEKFSACLRSTIDQLLDGQHTGRWDWQTLRKTEKTHMGTLVEINLHRTFDFADGLKMDYRIEGVEVDCKFSQSLGGWEFPLESIGHLCLLVWANDDIARWEAGLIRVDESVLGAPNRDSKRKLPRAGEASVLWLYDRPKLPLNLLLQLTDEQRDRIFNARAPTGRASGQTRINELFRCIQKTIVPRAIVLTVGIQDDPMKRARDARLTRHLGKEGLLILGHQGSHPDVARSLGLPVPRKGEFISVRVAVAESGFPGPKAEIGGTEWREANEDDPIIEAPRL